jgi:NitT/TauT family transport system ATP-binding protein
MAIERRGAAIEIAHVCRQYGTGSSAVLALDDINLRVEPGEFLCIVGPSGCGK